MRNNKYFIVTIDGRAHVEVFTTIKGVTRVFPELPYTALREAFMVSTERVFAKDNKLYRISIATVSRIPGRGKHLNLPKKANG